MSIQPPQGILTIPNATLRVGKLAVDSTAGFDTVFNNVERNTILLVDSVEYTENKQWDLKMPNIFVATFEIRGAGSSFNFRNTSIGDAGVGYTLTFSGTTLTLKYSDSDPVLATATIPDLGITYGKVYLTYEKQYFTVTVDGTRVLSYKDTVTRNPPDGEYINFFAGGDGGFKNLKVVAGHLISDGTSNVSLYGGLAVTSNLEVGSSNLFVDTVNSRVGVGTTTPEATLHVSGNAYVSSNLEVGSSNLFVDTVNSRVGVGTDTPKESLDVVGNMHLTRVSNVSQIKVDSNVVTEYTGPHDRPLRKYPEVALTADATNANGVLPSASGYKGYKVSASSTYDTGPSYPAWKAFNGVWHNNGNANGSDVWMSTGSAYGGTDGVYNKSPPQNLGTGANNGEWIKVELPRKIKLNYIKIYPRYQHSSKAPEDFVVYGSNDNINWSAVLTKTGASITSDYDETGHTFNADVLNTGYKYFGLVTTKIRAETDFVGFSELELYGHEEGSGSLDTTLKSAYNVPATTGTQLEVYYDAKDLADGAVSSDVTDLSPNSNDGSVAGNPQVSNGAFVFDGVDDSISATSIGNSVGDWTHSSSFWFKFAVVEDGSFYSIGPNTVSGQNVTSLYYDASGYIQTSVSGGVYTRCGNVFLLPNNWYHITTVKRTNAQDSIYLNGNELPVTVYANTELQMSLPANTSLNIGTRPDQSSFFNGSIANFRLYSKALNADQVQELYDYQKDYFLGSKSQVTLYKGHLGVGVTEPSGQLELAGDERLQEYPPRGLVGDNLVFDPAGNAYDYNVEGHGVFKLSSTTMYHASTSDDRRIYKLFDKGDSTTTHWSSFNGSSPYEATTNAQITTLDGGGTITAHFAEIQMPYKITLKKYILRTANLFDRALKTGMIVGSNDGNVFHVLHNVPDFGFTSTFQSKEYTVDNTTTPYRIFRLLLMNTVGSGTCNMTEWRLFGTPGPTTLDKGSLSLGRSLDVPRVSRYDVDTETPRPEKLVVDFDTTVNSSPTDISGQGNHGAFYNGASYSPADKAFKFDGSSNQYIQGNLNNTGDIDFSISTWLRRDSLDSGFPFSIGTISGAGTGMAFDIYASGGSLYFWVNGGTMLHDTDGAAQFPAKTWVHVVATRTGTTLKVYLNGVDWTSNMAVDSNGSATLSLPANAIISLGRRQGSATVDFTGQISNFKLYNVALEPSEVKKLYNLGRTGRSMVISDTAVGIGKVPEAQLDVRGTLRSDGLTVGGDIYATGNITGYSDRRAKSDIEKIENALEKIEQLNGYTFTMKGKRYTGLIAQEILPILPEAVTGSEETNYAVAYGNMMGLIVEAIKELKQKIG